MTQSDLFHRDSEWAVRVGISSSWSPTRASSFRNCQREFFFRYVASGLPAQDPRKGFVKSLKRLEGAKLVIGSLLHTLFEKIIKGMPRYEKPPEEYLDPDKWLAVLRQMWKDAVLASRESVATGSLDKAFMEHYYTGIQIDTEGIKRTAEDSIRNFLGLEVVQTAGLDVDLILIVEKLERFFYQPLFHPPTDKGFPVWSKMDFARKVAQVDVSIPRIEVWDWKTGKPKLEDIDQVAFYVLVALHKEWHKDASQVKANLFYSTEGELIDKTFTQAELKMAERRCMEEYEAMRQAVAHPEIYVEDFPVTKELWRCKFCPFYEMCYESREIGKGELRT